MDFFYSGNKPIVNFPIINELVVKLAGRCNINCSYCYWFKDPLVMQAPKLLQPDVVDILLQKLEEHITQFQLSNFSISFHGGEPTLFPKSRFKTLCQSLNNIAKRTKCHFKFFIQSNALLIDEEWIALLKEHKVTIGISLDGNKHLHDKYRIDNKGRGTYLKTIEAIERIKASGLDIYILSVANLASNPDELVDHFVYELGLKKFDVLVPQLHHEQEVISTAGYYCRLYDRYQDELIDEDTEIRILDAIMTQSLGGNSSNQGYGFISTVTLLTNGFLEATDDLRMISDLTPSKINIKTHSLQQVTEDPLWQEVYNSSLNLADECKNCEYEKQCGGGMMVSRWSDENRFNNPSVYCRDIKKIIRHVETRLAPHLETIKKQNHN